MEDINNSIGEENEGEVLNDSDDIFNDRNPCNIIDDGILTIDDESVIEFSDCIIRSSSAYSDMQNSTASHISESLTQDSFNVDPAATTLSKSPRTVQWTTSAKHKIGMRTTPVQA